MTNTSKSKRIKSSHFGNTNYKSNTLKQFLFSLTLSLIRTLTYTLMVKPSLSAVLADLIAGIKPIRIPEIKMIII